MLLFFTAIIFGLILLIWSADKFIEGAKDIAIYAGVPPLLVGMLIIGFGTSAPEVVVSIIASLQGNPEIALGNAYGSNIANIALILGVTAILAPIIIDKSILRKEFPVLIGITLFSLAILYDGTLSKLDSIMLLSILFFLISYSIYRELKNKDSNLNEDEFPKTPTLSKNFAIFWLIIGLIILVISSRILVWGAVGIATKLGVSDLIIGLTIIAIGTSLPELASSIAAVKKGEHNLAIGNVIGSNIFNTLAVVGIAGFIKPLEVDPHLFNRDILFMTFLTILLFVICMSKSINKKLGILLLGLFVGYTSYLISIAI